MDLLTGASEHLNPFRVFVKDELQEDNLNFWLAVEKFKQMKRGSEEFRIACRRIYNTYIKKKRIRCITAMIRNRIRRIFNTPGRKLPSDLFSPAQAVVFLTMHQSVYFRYIETDVGKRWYMDRLISKKYGVHLMVIQRCWKRAVFRYRLAKEMKSRRKKKLKAQKQRRDEKRALKDAKEKTKGKKSKKSKKKSSKKESAKNKKVNEIEEKVSTEGLEIDLSKTSTELSPVKS